MSTHILVLAERLRTVISTAGMSGHPKDGGRLLKREKFVSGVLQSVPNSSLRFCSMTQVAVWDLMQSSVRRVEYLHSMVMRLKIQAVRLLLCTLFVRSFVRPSVPPRNDSYIFVG